MRFLFIYFILIWSHQANGQCDQSIIGHWRVMAAFNGEVYFNLKTDSTFISSEIKEMYPDTSRQNKILTIAKELFGATNFIFEKNGVYKLFLDTSFQYEGKYCYKSETNILQWSSKNSLGQNISETTNSRIEKDLLYISQKWDEGERTLDLVLERRQ